MVHAYLFVGSDPRTLQRRAESFLRSVLCLNSSQDPSACACRSCQTHLATHPDSITLEPPEEKKRIDISVIRSALEKFSVTPWLSVSKVALICQADLLTEEASNALLKTLEEPPPHSTIVLTTTDQELLPDTLLSRCQILRFVPEEKATAMGSPADAEEAIRLLDPATRNECVIDERLKGPAEHARQELEQLANVWLGLLHDLFSLQLNLSRDLFFADKRIDLQRMSPLYPIRHILTLFDRLRSLQKSLQQNGNPKLLAESFLLSLP